MQRVFPGISVLRMDADTTKRKLSHQMMFDKFKKENISVLLGTQMVTKGLDFPSVTLVGVLSADSLLNLDDYRANERTFAQLTQVCGRAGRGEIPGRAVIQTYNPSSTVLKLAQTQDYKAFYQGEIKLRALLHNPPFVKMVSLMVSSERESQAAEYAGRLAELLKRIFQKYPQLCVAFYGPAPAPITRIKNRFRYRILLKMVVDEKVYDLFAKVQQWHIQNKSKCLLDIMLDPENVL